MEVRRRSREPREKRGGLNCKQEGYLAAQCRAFAASRGLGWLDPILHHRGFIGWVRGYVCGDPAVLFLGQITVVYRRTYPAESWQLRLALAQSIAVWSQQARLA